MIKTNDKTRFTFRIPKDINEYIETKAEEWKSTKTAALIRILNEYSQQYPLKQLTIHNSDRLTGTDS